MFAALCTDANETNFVGVFSTHEKADTALKRALLLNKFGEAMYAAFKAPSAYVTGLRYKVESDCDYKDFVDSLVNDASMTAQQLLSKTDRADLYCLSIVECSLDQEI